VLPVVIAKASFTPGSRHQGFRYSCLAQPPRRVVERLSCVHHEQPVSQPRCRVCEPHTDGLLAALVLEREPQLGAVREPATFAEDDVQFDHLTDSKVTETLAGGLDRDGCGVLP
jgi:hypothetical protein